MTSYFSILMQKFFPCLPMIVAVSPTIGGKARAEMENLKMFNFVGEFLLKPDLCCILLSYPTQVVSPNSTTTRQNSNSRRYIISLNPYMRSIGPIWSKNFSSLIST